MNARRQPDPLHNLLVERVNDWAENALNPQACAAALHQVLDICRECEHNSLRWEDQLEVPSWVPKMRARIAEALGDRPGGDVMTELETCRQNARILQGKYQDTAAALDRAHQALTRIAERHAPDDHGSCWTCRESDGASVEHPCPDYRDATGATS